MLVPRNTRNHLPSDPTKPKVKFRGVEFHGSSQSLSLWTSRALYHSLWLLAALLLTACGPVTLQDQVSVQPGGVQLRPGETLGQSFISRYDGLNGITLQFTNETNRVQELTLMLLDETDPPQIIRTSVLQIEPDAFMEQSFHWAPVRDSTQASYLLQLELRTEGLLNFRVASGDAYLDGAMTVNGKPKDAQLAFETSYAPVDLLWGAGHGDFLLDFAPPGRICGFCPSRMGARCNALSKRHTMGMAG